jgi:small subunit ribosomal protein S21
VNRKRNNNNDPAIGGLHVEVKNGDFNRAMRKFKKKVQEDGLIQEIRKREFYEKPSAKRKRMKAAARSRWLKKLARSEHFQVEQIQNGNKRR